MNVNPKRRTNPAVCFILLALGACCLFGTSVAAFLLKDKIPESTVKKQKAGYLSLDLEISSVEQELKFKDFQLRVEETQSKQDKMLREAEEAANKKSNKRKPVVPITKNSELETDAKIQKLRDERLQLRMKRDALLATKQAKKAKGRSWSEWFDDYNIELLLATLPFVGLWLWLVPQTFWLKLPPRNPLSLTDFERRCVLSLAVAIITSMLGFAFFLWFLTIRS